MEHLEVLVGKKVQRLFMSDDYLKFQTDGGDFAFRVDGDCCSSSYFYDFYGVENLLKNGPIKAVEEIDLKDDGKRRKDDEEISCYGYRLTTESPEFGEVSSVMSFRNSSNGYYGGSIEKAPNFGIVAPEIIKDFIGV